MPGFQGSGFLIELPEGCTDASAYTFILPTEGEYTPYITIKAERMQEAQDLKAYVSKQQASLQESVEEYAVIQYVESQHEGMDAVLTTIEWGSVEARICQKIIYFLMHDQKGSKIFTLTGTDLASQFQKSEQIFYQVFKSFIPNQIQLIEA
jgi:hypothetical protein